MCLASKRLKSGAFLKIVAVENVEGGLSLAKKNRSLLCYMKPTNKIKYGRFGIFNRCA
jgi:hypothetical protein